MRVLRSLFAIALVIGVIAGGAVIFAYMQFTAKGPLAANTVYQVGQGSKRSIGAQLQDAGIVHSAGIFTAAAYVRGALGNRLKAGEYEFPANASVEQVLSMIISGNAKTYKVTIPEGWTTQMAVARIAENEVLTGEVAAVPVEGAIMPETYVFRRGLTRQKILDDMQAAQAKMLDEAWRFLRDPTIRAYVTEALKTWRKRNAAMILATQTVDDFASADLLRTVVEGCPTKLFLANPGLDRARYADIFHLNETEVALLSDLLPRRQLLLKRPALAKVLNLTVDPHSYWLYTNTPIDNDRVQAVFREFGFAEGLNRLATASA